MSSPLKLNCLIVDDEPLARKGMEEYVKEVEFLHWVDSCEHAVKAATLLNNRNIDLILLDIHMPKVSGIDFLKTLKSPPMIILTTAYPEYALEGYSLDIVDYLVKPIPYVRFLKAVQKAYDYHLLKLKTPVNADYFFIKCGHKYERISYSEVLYAEAMQNYCIIYTHARKLIAYITLTGLEEQLPKERFLKVHKSFLVSVEKINALDGHEILIGTSRIPISRTLKDDVLQKIMGNKLFRRN